jgi:predicted NBD/HSP70 family sugar kinase
VLARREFRFAENTTPEQVGDAVHDFVEECRDGRSFDQSKMLGLGIAAIGPIRKNKGLIYRPYHMRARGWDIVPIRDILELKTGLPTTMDSISETALLAEIMYGQARNSDSSTYLWFDRGVGCAIYSHGALGIGNLDLSSSVGHIVIDFNGERCICGKQGCLETYASMEAIHRRIAGPATAVSSTAQADPWTSSPELDAVTTLLETPTAEARAALENIAKATATAVSNFIHIARPDLVLYGGRTIRRIPSLFESCLEKIRAEYDADHLQSMRFLQSDFSAELLIRGSAFLAFNNYLDFTVNKTI